MKWSLFFLLLFPAAARADFPWYDSERQDYRRYSAEEWGAVMPDETQSTPGPALEPPPVPLFLLEILLYALGAIAIFFAVRWLLQIKPMRKVERSMPRPVSFQEFAFQNFTEARTAAELRSRIEIALGAGDLRQAGKLIFLYLIARMTEEGEIAVSASSTAREIAREMKKKRNAQASIIEKSRQAFEKSLYASREESGLPELWLSIATDWP